MARRHARGDRGAVLIEAVVALPVAFLFLVGTIEAGSLMKTYSSTASAVRSASRVASVAGSDAMSDQRILARIDRESAGIEPARIRKIVIWHAAGPGEPVPAACDPAPGSLPNASSVGVHDGGVGAIGACNVYLNPGLPDGALAKATGRAGLPASYSFGCEGPLDPGAGHKLDCNWPGKDRQALTSPRNHAGPGTTPDFIGVHVQVDHRLSSAVVLKAVTVRETSISLLEPQGYTFL